MRNYEKEKENRIKFIRDILAQSGAKGIIYGNSGGKDSALVGILCKLACDDTEGLLLPCSRRNFEEDMRDGLEVANKYGIATRTVDIKPMRDAFVEQLGSLIKVEGLALANLAPRIRMATLYAVAAAENRLVAGTGNRSEAYMGYFTKWGDGAHDFNPIADLTVTEIYEFLRYLDAPKAILEKAPSAALFDGQTDEGEMGITYARIDDYLLNGNASSEDRELIERYHARSEHKRSLPIAYSE